MQSPPRLYLFTPELADTAAFANDLDAALLAGDIATVCLRLAEADERTLIERIKVVGAVAHARDIALLLDGRPELVARADADGAHLTGLGALRAALPTLKPERIVGAGGLRSRHDAMLAAEDGADYAMFGEPDRKGGHPPIDVLKERLTWWAELVEVPCIGYAATPAEIRLLAETGADFVALGAWIWTQTGGAEAAIAVASEQLAAAFTGSA
jgi:thiamine-phosphate pyrophosphorylase